jgi:hypothetical protein
MNVWCFNQGKKHHLQRHFIPRNNVHPATKLNIFLLTAMCAWENLVLIHMQNQIGFLPTHGLNQIHMSHLNSASAVTGCFSVQYKHYKLNKKKATALFISTYFYFLVYGGIS